MEVPTPVIPMLNTQDKADHVLQGRMICDYEHPHSCFFHKERPKYFLLTNYRGRDAESTKNIDGKCNGNQVNSLIPSNTRNQTHKRSPMTLQQKHVLNDWLMKHKQYPYPTSEEKEILAQITGLTKEQIRVWFTNSRMRNTNLENFTRKNAKPQIL